MSLNNSNIAVIVGSANKELGHKICKIIGVNPTKSEVITFSEGNTFVRVLESIRGKDVYVIQSICFPVNENFMELLFWIDSLRLASAKTINVVMPFFSYAKGDKKDEPRVSIRARVCAEALETTGLDRLITMDLHSQQIQGFFKKPVDHLSSKVVIAKKIKEQNFKNLVIASADVGFGKQAFKYSEILGVATVIGNKIRTDHSEKSKVWSVVGDVKDKTVVIVDDIVFTGGSLISMAEQCVKLGAKEVYAAVTHGVLTPGAQKKIANSPIQKLYVTDTVEYEFEDYCSKIERVSTASAFANVIVHIQNSESIAAICDD